MKIDNAEGTTMEDATQPRRIHSKRMFDALRDAGVIRAGDYVRRIVIDIQHDAPVLVYVERIGDERLLQVAQGLDGVEIQWADSPETAKG